MKKLFILLSSSFLLLSESSFAQYSYQDVNSQTVAKEVNHIATDNNGSIIISGGFNTTLTFGNYTVTNNYPNPNYPNNGGNAPTYFIARETPIGNGNYDFVWAKSIVLMPDNKGGVGSATIRDMTADQSGNIYITGWFTGTIKFDAISLSASFPSSFPSSSIFTAKLSTAGNFLWAIKESVKDGADARAVVADASGNAYITGYKVRKFIHGTTSSGWVSDVDVIKYNSSGVKLWEKTYANSANTYLNMGFNLLGSDIKTDGSNIYVTGTIYGTVNFGNGYSFNASNLNSFLVKLDANGNTLWAKTVTGGDNQARSLLADNGDIYIGGFYQNNVSFGNNISLSGGTDFLAKYSSTGTVSWAVEASTSRLLFKHPSGTIAILYGGSVYIVLRELSPADGSQVAISTSTSGAKLGDVALSSDGFVFSMNMSGSMDFVGITITSTQPPNSANTDMMIVKYTTPTPLIAHHGKIIPEQTSSGILLYPNPATNQINIRSKNDKMLGNVIIYDVSGKMVYKNFTGNSQATIDVKNFSSGLYYLKSDQLQASIKFVKQ